MQPQRREAHHFHLIYSRGDLRRRGIAISNTTLLRLEKTGKFPARIRLSPHCIAWVAAEIDAYIDELASAREVA
jgi:predicted DNA-binding transcriptional regulator AlpA